MGTFLLLCNEPDRPSQAGTEGDFHLHKKWGIQSGDIKGTYPFNKGNAFVQGRATHTAAD